MKKIIWLFITASLLVFAGCQSGTGGDPKEVLVKFFDALAAKNIEEAKKYVTKDSEGMMSMVQMGMNSSEDSSAVMYAKDKIDLSDAVIDGDRATVAVKDKSSGESTDFVLKKESGDWKVAFDKATLMGMATQKMKEKGIDQNMIDSGVNSAMEELKNMTDEEKENMKQMMDSASKVFEQMKASGQFDDSKKMMDSASDILKKLQDRQ